LTVEVAQVSRRSIADEIVVVGNLIGDATVAVAPRTAGRVQDVYVRLGDRVNRGQRLAKIEDFEIVEQVKQAEAAQEVSLATIRQREADLKLAETSAQRSRNLYERQLLPKQTLDDNEARYQAAMAQLDLARAQTAQSKARLDELRINLANTIITSPVNGFVARRAVDPGAFVSQNQQVADVVDITTVRLVANIVEKDLKQLHAGNTTRVQVDAYPGETFTGRVRYVSPAVTTDTRALVVEAVVPNDAGTLKPGSFATALIEEANRSPDILVPGVAVRTVAGTSRVFVVSGDRAEERIVTVGQPAGDLVEITSGLKAGENVATTNVATLADGVKVAAGK
jgi:RND family efflux transporter MFP subunit